MYCGCPAGLILPHADPAGGAHPGQQQSFTGLLLTDERQALVTLAEQFRAQFSGAVYEASL